MRRLGQWSNVANGQRDAPAARRHVHRKVRCCTPLRLDQGCLIPMHSSMSAEYARSGGCSPLLPDGGRRTEH